MPEPLIQHSASPPATGRRPDATRLHPGALTVAGVCLGLAIHLHDGEYSSGAIALVTVSIMGMIVAIARPGRGELARPAEDRGDAKILAAGILLQLVVMGLRWPGVDLPHRGGLQLLPFYALLGVAAAIVILVALRAGAWMAFRWRVLGVFLLLGVWMVHSSPHPHIDVWVFQQDAAGALLHGHNPYAMTFPDIYHSTAPGAQAVYGPGLVVDDRVQFGFPYPPASLILATMGFAFGGDHRYAQVAGLALAGFLIMADRGRVALLAAALLLFTPRMLFVIGRGWTEPFVVMFLAATVYCAVRSSRWLPLALGLLLATKQYLLLAVPLTFFLLPAGWRSGDWVRLLLKTALVAIAVTLPFAAWDFRAFWKSTVTVQGVAPFRWDALSYLVWYGFRGHLVTEPSTALFWSTFAALASLAFALARSPRTPAGFAASLALMSLGFFAFNKQAFCNYYFFVIGAICCAIGAGSAVMRPPLSPAPA